MGLSPVSGSTSPVSGSTFSMELGVLSLSLSLFLPLCSPYLSLLLIYRLTCWKTNFPHSLSSLNYISICCSLVSVLCEIPLVKVTVVDIPGSLSRSSWVSFIFLSVYPLSCSAWLLLLLAHTWSLFGVLPLDCYSTLLSSRGPKAPCTP